MVWGGVCVADSIPPKVWKADYVPKNGQHFSSDWARQFAQVVVFSIGNWCFYATYVLIVYYWSTVRGGPVCPAASPEHASCGRSRARGGCVGPLMPRAGGCGVGCGLPLLCGGCVPCQRCPP